MLAQFGKALRIQPEIVARAATLFLHQAGGLENLKMLRYGGPAHRELIGEFADRRRLLAEQMEHRLPGRIGESPQELPCVSHTLL